MQMELREYLDSVAAHPGPSARLQSLIDADKVVAIFERTGDTTRIRPRDVLVLVNFLHYVTWRYRVQGSGPGYPQIKTDP
jgi:hypothetical protein